MARCDTCKLRRDGGNGACPLPADLEAARAARGEHDCAVYRPVEVIKREKKVRKNLAHRDFLLTQDGLF